jgi:phage tail sheath protein FI
MCVWGVRGMQSGTQVLREPPVDPRLAFYVEWSLSYGLQWACFEPNAELLWAEIRNRVEKFLHGLFRAGVLKGSSPQEAYWVRCGSETMTHDDMDKGRLHVLVGFAPRKPAEFVVLRITQTARASGGS